MPPNDMPGDMGPIHPDELARRWPAILKSALHKADENIAFRERTGMDASIPRDARKLMVTLGGLRDLNMISITEAVERLDLLLLCVRDDEEEDA